MGQIEIFLIKIKRKEKKKSQNQSESTRLKLPSTLGDLGCSPLNCSNLSSLTMYLFPYCFAIFHKTLLLLLFFHIA